MRHLLASTLCLAVAFASAVVHADDEASPHRLTLTGVPFSATYGVSFGSDGYHDETGHGGVHGLSAGYAYGSPWLRPLELTVELAGFRYETSREWLARLSGGARFFVPLKDVEIGFPFRIGVERSRGKDGAVQLGLGFQASLGVDLRVWVDSRLAVGGGVHAAIGGGPVHSTLNTSYVRDRYFRVELGTVTLGAVYAL